jgi:hypothetical protein
LVFSSSSISPPPYPTPFQNRNEEEEENADVDAELQKEIKAMEKRLEAKVPYACILLLMYPW